jgi:hypothetical protein
MEPTLPKYVRHVREYYEKIIYDDEAEIKLLTQRVSTFSSFTVHVDQKVKYCMTSTVPQLPTHDSIQRYKFFFSA